MFKRNFILFLVLFFIFVPIVSFAEDSLSITRWKIDSTLLDNGDLSISEDITFNYNDKFNGVYRSIVLKGTDGVDALEVFQMNEGVEIPFTYVESAEKGDNEVFTATNENNTLKLMIFSPSENETKTYRIKYVVKNVAVRHKDTGELYYKFIGSENDTSIDYLSATINLPGNDREKTKIFAHGPLNGQINFIEDNLIKLEVSNVQVNTYVEARILFPQAFIDSSVNNGNSSFDTIMNEELALTKSIEEKAIRREKNKGIFNNISLFLAAIGALITGFSVNKLRRDVDIYDSMKSPNPEDISPAELRLFYSSVVDSRSLMTTIFDLARRGYIDIDEIENEKKKKKDFLFSKTIRPRKDLLSHEEFLLHWLFNTIGDGTKASTKDIENYRKKNFSAYGKDSYALQKKTKEELNKRGYRDGKGKSFGYITLILSISLFLVAFISIALEGFYGLIALFLGVGIFIYSINLFLRKSDKGYIQYQLWKDFKKDLEKQNSLLDEYDISIPKDKILIYALALGLPMKSMNKFRDWVPESYTPTHWSYWYYMTNKSGGSSFEDRFNSSFYGSSAGTTSSSIGGGGGFSGGGGGGAGGGGAGGF